MPNSDPTIGCPKQPWQIFKSVLPKTADVSMVKNFAARFGSPSERDGGIAVWPIRARKQKGTFSEVVGEARLHTDSQYRETPETAFILACIRPARLGGDSMLLSAQAAIKAAERNLGMTEILLLRQPIWQWTVPAVFRAEEDAAVSPSSEIIGPDGTIRWRDDNVVCDTKEKRIVVSKFSMALRNSKEIVQVRLEAGDVLVCDNKFALHGRTAFDDFDRLLYRVRLI